SSADTEKHAFLERLKTSHPFVDLLLQTDRQPLYRDVCGLLDATKSYRYVCICADDDHMSFEYLQHSIDALERDATAVCSYGNFLSFRGGQFFVEHLTSLEPSPVVRLENAFNPRSFNSLFFTVVRRSAMQPWADFCRDHPLIGPFFDFVHFWS